MFWKAKPVYTVTIPNPCTEKWGEMTQVECGRFCQACNTVVTDFSRLNDDEIISALQRSGGRICGRFLNTQLNRRLKETSPVLPLPRYNWLSRIAASLLMFYSYSNQASAQQKNAPVVQHPPTNPTDGNPVTKTGTANVIIRGKLLNYHNNSPVKNVELQIKGYSFKSVTDANGRFKFLLPDSLVAKDLIIGPSPSSRQFMDTTFSMVMEEKVAIDDFPFSKDVVLYRYPAKNLAIEITAKRPLPQLDNRQYFTTGLIAIDTPPPPQKIKEKHKPKFRIPKKKDN